MRRIVIGLVAVAALARAVEGQVTPPATRPVATRPMTARDSVARRDSLARVDSIARQESLRTKDPNALDTTTVRWPEPDSVMRALLARTGYDITRFQATSATYDAVTKDLRLDAGAKQRAAVDRNGQVMVSDSTIYFNQTTNKTTNLGCYVLNFPGSVEAPIRSARGPDGKCGQVSYDASSRSAQFTRANVPFNNGANWFLYVNAGAAQIDTSKSGAGAATIYVRGGRITSCPDSIPDYYFAGKTMKRTASGTVIARDVTLFIGDIPTLWLPFIFQNVKTGRVSGLLTTRFGISDIVRNSPTYHRNIENFGYYWAISDYMDAAAWIDWRSGGGGSNTNDPGYVRYNGDWQYNWLGRFLSGNVGAKYEALGNGSSNLGIRWGHGQQFSHDGQLRLDINYVTNTTIQRQNSFDPVQALATISSQAQYSRKFGPASLSLGGSRTQYPGRPRVDQSFPTLQISTVPIKIGSHVTWTPAFSYAASQQLHIDQPGTFQVRYGPGGTVDSIKKSSYATVITFNSPLKVFSQDLTNSFRINSQRNKFPEQFKIVDVTTGDSVDTRVYNEIYQTDIDWTPAFQLPPLRSNRWNLSPSVSLANVDPGAFWVATERTNGRYVAQSKRLSYGVSATPTLYGLFGGFGPFAALRHTLTPSIGYTFAPTGTISDEYLVATRRSRKGYLGALRQNSVAFGMTTSLEAKVAGDTLLGQGGKLKVIGLTMSSFSYNFERLRAPEVTSTKWWRGLTTERFSYSVRSDLLPGIEFSSDYSLFQGSTTSDTAVFSPYRESTSASLTLSRNSNPFAVLTKLFGKAVPAAQHAGVAPVDPNMPPQQGAQARELAAQPVAGARQAGERFLVPPSQGWRLALTLSSARPRPAKGGNVVAFNPEALCAVQANGNPFILEECIQRARLNPTDALSGLRVNGGPVYNVPASTNVGGDLGFNLTPRWTVGWRTNYDFQRHEFASHVVNLQRDLHDWRATFGFSQSPNGNFAFNFSIGLKAQPDLKFDYARNSIRSQAGY